MRRFSLGIIYPRAIGLGLAILVLAIVPILVNGRRLNIFKDGYFLDNPISSSFIVIGWLLAILLGLLPLTYSRVIKISESKKEILYGTSILFFIDFVKLYDLNLYDKVIVSRDNKSFNSGGTFAFTAIDGYSTKEIDIYLKNTNDKTQTLKIQNIGNSNKAEKIYNQLKVHID